MPPSAHTTPSLSTTTITVWTCPPQPPGEMAAWLSPAERDRAQRYRYQVDADRFITARALVRAAVSLCTGTALPDVDIHVHPHGSPTHGRPFVPAGPSFSISHAGAWVVVAIVEGDGSVGVDIEPVAAVTGKTDDLVHAVSPHEEPAAGWTPETFTRTWVRREAILKAVGTGLLAPRDDLVLSPGDSPAAVLHTGRALPSSDRLRLVDLDLGAHAHGHLAAVALCTDPLSGTPTIVLADGSNLLAQTLDRERQQS